MKNHYPAFGMCGYSGSGKTTVIEKVVEQLTRRALRIGVVKHDVHGLNVDHEGKDTDRFFRAGADVVIRGPEQCFFRAHRRGDIPLPDLLRLIGPYYDLVLVEGHKSTPLEQKVWLCSDDGEEPPPEARGIRRVLRRDENRVRIVQGMIDSWLPVAWRAAPLYAGILANKQADPARPNGTPANPDDEACLEQAANLVRPFVDEIIIVGRTVIPASLRCAPMLPDAPDAGRSLAGMRSAMRWAPLTSWLFVAPGPQLPSHTTVRKILESRRPGVWAVLPQPHGPQYPEPGWAYCDFRAGPLLEQFDHLDELARCHSIELLAPSPRTLVADC